MCTSFPSRVISYKIRKILSSSIRTLSFIIIILKGKHDENCFTQLL